MTRTFVGTLLCGCVAVTLAFLVPGMATAQGLQSHSDSIAEGSRGTSDGTPILFNQAGACGGAGPASQRFPDFANSVLQSADDFDVPAGQAWTLSGAVAQGAFFGANPNNGPIDNVVVQIWDDAPGLPGTMLCEEVGVNEDAVPAGPNVRLSLTGDCAALSLTEGTYWVSIMAEMPFAPAGQWAWVPNASMNGNEWAFQDPTPLIGPPCGTWGAGTSFCGVGALFDTCFTLEGIDGPPEPDVNTIDIPTLGQFGLLAMLFSLVGAGLYRIRRRS